ncbi:variable large family protein (plasmid) [Borrelia coriaceae]|uniref:variable large family protein n=1 Tax=Borrelia coriaceae TaxID=144 RepID=UPI00047FB394|nr:variable large family protein [Borrelia coriaceae]UPA17528.1 variable large family protein [Borrelia coriaceae]
MKINIKNIRVKSICATLFISIFLACNNGIEELEKQRDSILSISNLRQQFLDIFTSFGEMFTDTLGIRADTTKSDIGKYFTKFAYTINKTKEKLNDIVAENGNYPKVKEEVEKFIKETLDKISEGAKEAAKGATGAGAIGNAKQGQNAAPAKVDSVNSLIKGIKAIVEVVSKGQGDAEVSKINNNQQKIIGKLLGVNASDGTEQQAAAASASIGAVTGTDILKAISKSGIATNKAITSVTNAAEIAVANAASEEFSSSLKDDAVIAAGIALRAMAENGTFVGNNTNSDSKNVNAVNGVVANAVTKVLSTLTIAIRNTVDVGLKEISKVLGEVKQRESFGE